MISSISLELLMPKACEILSKKMRPVHYRQLATEAASSLYPGEKISFVDIAEDLRGKGKRFPGESYGMRYTGGSAGSYVLMSHWLCNEPSLFPVESFSVRISMRECLDASIETALRMPHMKNKFCSPDIGKAARVAKGLMIERHVERWFRQNWPLPVIDADNKEIWNMPCRHDFKLSIPGDKFLLVDVAGKNRDGTFGCAPDKPKADIHVLAGLDFDLNEVVIEGFVSKSNFTEQVPTYKQFPVSALVFWCNCNLNGISFESMRTSKYCPKHMKHDINGKERFNGR